VREFLDSCARKERNSHCPLVPVPVVRILGCYYQSSARENHPHKGKFEEKGFAVYRSVDNFCLSQREVSATRHKTSTQDLN